MVEQLGRPRGQTGCGFPSRELRLVEGQEREQQEEGEDTPPSPPSMSSALRAPGPTRHRHGGKRRIGIGQGPLFSPPLEQCPGPAVLQQPTLPLRISAPGFPLAPWRPRGYCSSGLLLRFKNNSSEGNLGNSWSIRTLRLALPVSLAGLGHQADKLRWFSCFLPVLSSLL